MKNHHSYKIFRNNNKVLQKIEIVHKIDKNHSHLNKININRIDMIINPIKVKIDASIKKYNKNSVIIKIVHKIDRNLRPHNNKINKNKIDLTIKVRIEAIIMKYKKNLKSELRIKAGYQISNHSRRKHLRIILEKNLMINHNRRMEHQSLTLKIYWTKILQSFLIRQQYLFMTCLKNNKNSILKLRVR